jgi:DNA mismatch repair protein MutS
MPPKKRKAQVASGKGPQDAAPMERLYFQLYDTNVQNYGPLTGILLQVGRFFEMYDYVEVATGQARTNVQILAEICGCVVEHKPSADPKFNRLFWGFPETSLPKFERLLIVAGYSVPVYVQEKNSAGEVIARPLDHVSSPGTYYDAEGGLAIRKEEQCMLGVYVEPWTDERKGIQFWSVATTAFDIMTGSCFSTEADIQLIDGKPVFDCMTPFWSLHPPAEVIFCWSSADPIPRDEDIASFVSPSTRSPPIHKIVLEPKSENSVATDRLRINLLEQVYKPATSLPILEFLHINLYPMIRRSLFHMLKFIQEHNVTAIKSLNNHSVWCAENHVLLGNAALQQLAMLPLNSDKPQESLLYWLQKAQTSMGRQTLRERLLKPTAEIEELEERQERIAAHRSEPTSTLTASLKGMYDLPRLYRRFQLRSATTQDLLQLFTTYEKAEQVLKQCTDKVYDVQDADILSHVTGFLKQFDSTRIRSSGVNTHPWTRGMYPELDAYEDEWQTLETSMIALKNTWNEVLKDDDAIQWTVREDAPFTFTTTQRRSICIVNNMKLKNIVVTTSKYGSAKTVMLLETSEVIAANQAAIRLRQTWSTAIAEQWTAFWDTWIHEGIKMGTLQRLAETIGIVDAELTLATLSNTYGYTRPNYIETSAALPAGVHVHELRHPIIERINTSTPYVPHSLAIGVKNDTADAQTSNGILLYGVNAAGKSSLGKALGLAVLMAQTGMPVAASAMTLIPYTSIFTRILGNDNLWAGMSSFVVEMTEFRSILRAASPRTLIIGDELCAGTETASATSIVAAGIQRLADQNAQFLLATHLHELGEIVKNPKIAAYHLSVHSDPSNHTLIYDRKLRPGCGSPMYGLEVCRGLDMDKEFLEAAFAYRKRFFAGPDAHLSHYNANLVVDACAICGSKDSLETHHIVPQAAADKNAKISLGTHKNHVSNLVSLCDNCHEKHHQGLLEIQGWVATTTGRKLEYSLR